MAPQSAINDDNTTSSFSKDKSQTNELSHPQSVRTWLAQNHPKQLSLIDKFEMELRLGRLSTSSTAVARGAASSSSSTSEQQPNANEHSNNNNNNNNHETTTGIYGGIGSDRRLVTFRTVELLRTLIGSTKWKNAAQLMILLRGLGVELHAAGGFREPAIGNIVRRIMFAVRDEVINADAAAAAAAAASNVKKSTSKEDDLGRIDEEMTHSFGVHTTKATSKPSSSTNTTTGTSSGLSLSSMLWAHPQHLTIRSSSNVSSSRDISNSNCNNNSSKGQTHRRLRTDSFNSTDSNSRHPYGNDDHHHTTTYPSSFYQAKPHFRQSVMEAIQEIMLELEDLHKNIDAQATAHIHTGEVILTYARSKTIEYFLKAAAKKRQFQVIVCEGAPHFGGHSMAKSLADAGIDTTVIHDSAAFAIMARVNKVLLPAHAVLADGGLIVPSGSHMVALAASINSVPLVCVTGMFKLCPMYPHGGQDTLQDLVSPSAVLDYVDLGDETMANVELINPVHDYIPPQLISLYITNIGTYQPSYIYRLLAEYYHNDDWESFE